MLIVIWVVVSYQFDFSHRVTSPTLHSQQKSWKCGINKESPSKQAAHGQLGDFKATSAFRRGSRL